MRRRTDTRLPGYPGWLCSLALLAAIAAPVAQADTEEEITALIVSDDAYVRRELKDRDNQIARQGSWEFWSSGGLIHYIAADSPLSQYVHYSLVSKHIKVVTLVEGRAAVAMYYVEGAYQEKGARPVDHYMTRVTEIFVKEDGVWKIRSAHYSPIAGGSGTHDTAMD